MKLSGIEWIGDIPDDWKVVSLSSVFIEHKEKNVGLKESNLLSLSYGKIKRKDINTNEGLLPESFETYNIIRKDDIVFRLTDLQNDKRSLRTAIATESGIITSAYVTLRSKKNVSSKYFHYLFHIYDICKVFYGMGDGVRQGMGFANLKKLPILIPTTSEYQKIADYLDEKCGEIDKTIEKQKKSIEKLKAYKQSLISETVTKGLNKSTPLKPSGIDYLGDIPTHWDVKKLKTLLKEPLTYGANESGILFNENEPRYIRITDIKDEQSLRDDTPQSLPENKAKDYILQNDDILFARSGATVGKTFIYKSDFGRCAFAGYLIRARMDVLQMLPIFFIYYSLSFCYFEWKSRIFIQATIQNIGANKYNNMEIPTPPISEQNQIAEYLDVKCSEIDSTINKKQNLIEKLDAYKKSLIFECVTGKREI